jgi:AraC-like DNA-binding protein
MLLIFSSKSFYQRVKQILHGYPMMNLNSLFLPNRVLQNNHPVCFIFSVDQEVIQDKINIIQMRRTFSRTPFIGVLSGGDIELARKCGEVGFNFLIEDYKLSSLDNHIHDIVEKSRLKITLEDLDISTINLPQGIIEILHYVQENYTEIFTVKELADFANVAECTLIREFKKYNLVSPKQLLLCFKLNHAVQLIKGRGIKIKDVAFQSGFTNEKRFYECFNKVFKCSPLEYMSKNAYA